MSKTAFFLIAAAALIGLGIAAYFLFFKSENNEGKPCLIRGIPGRITNGACIQLDIKEETLPCGGILNPC